MDYTAYVEKMGVHSLDGYNINLAKFKLTLPDCVSQGLVSQEDADYVLHGLEFGYDLGVDHDMLKGRRVHKNYSTAYENKGKLHKASISYATLR